MKFSKIINRISQINSLAILMILFTAIIITFSSCNNHKEGDGHNHGTEEKTTEKKNETTHEEAPPTIATLTAQ